jgi:hypothetical protein
MVAGEVKFRPVRVTATVEPVAAPDGLPERLNQCLTPGIVRDNKIPRQSSTRAVTLGVWRS